MSRDFILELNINNALKSEADVTGTLLLFFLPSKYIIPWSVSGIMEFSQFTRDPVNSL